MKQLIIFVIILIAAPNLYAQSWQWGVRGGGMISNGSLYENVEDMATDNAGNVYVLSNINGGGPITISGVADGIPTPGRRDMLVTSFSCIGAFRWKKLIGGGNDDLPRAIGADTLGNVYVTGYVSPPTLPGKLVEFDTDTTLVRTSVRTFFLVKYDTSGNFKWLRQPMPDTMSPYNHAYSQPRDMIVNPNGEVEILCHLQRGQLGGSSFVADTARAYLLKYNYNGEIIGLVKPEINWRQLNTPSLSATHLYSIRMAKSRQEKYIVSGAQHFTVFPPFNDPLRINDQPVVSRIFVASFNNNWQNEWVKQVDTSIVIGAYYRPALDADGSIFIAGPARDNASFNGFTVNNIIAYDGVPFVLKLNTAGDLIWGKNASANGESQGRGVAIGSGRLFVAGSFPRRLDWDNYKVENLLNIGYDVFLASLETQTGAVSQLDSLKGLAGYDDHANTIISDNRGNIYLGGELGYNMTIGSTTIQSAGGTSDFFVAKYGAANCSDSPVPLQLTAFTANWRGNDVLTRWQTAQEQNTKAFIVQRSNDAFRFDSIGTVAAKGNSNTTRQYTFTDFAPLSSDNLPSGQAGQQLSTVNSLFYRLKMLDRDGAFTYSPVAKVSVEQSNSISIWPNPATSMAIVSYPGRSRANIEVYNMLGVRVYSTTVTGGSAELATSSWPAGVYNVVLSQDGIRVKTSRVVVGK